MIKYRKRNDGLYVCTETYRYTSPRYGRTVVIYEGTVRDGASGPARDICPTAWFVHDQLCADGHWSDKTPVTAWQAAAVLSDILKRYGFWFRARTWRWTTFFVGCDRARANGWFRAD